MYSTLLKTNVTSIKFVGSYLLAGVGGELHVYETIKRKNTNWKLLENVKIFSPQNLYGIVPKEWKILVFGGRKLAVLEHSLEPLKFLIHKKCSLDDWILDAVWLDNEPDVVAVLTANNIVHKYNTSSEKVLSTLKSEELCILYSGKILNSVWEELIILAGTVFQEIIIWDCFSKSVHDESCQILHRLKGHKGVIFSVNYNSDTNMIYSTSDDRTVRIWMVQFFSKEEKPNWKKCSISLKVTIFSHVARVWKSLKIDGNKFISIGEDSLISIWNGEGECINQWYGHQGGGVWSVDYSEELSLIATGGSDGGINIWPLSDIEPPCIVYQYMPPNENGIPRTVALISKGKMVLITNEGRLRYFNGVHWIIVNEYKRYASYCILQISPNHDVMAMGNIDGDLMLLRVDRDTIIKIWEGNIVGGRIFSLLWLSNTFLIACGPEGELTFWEFLCKEDNPNLKLLYKFFLPKCKERWITSALLHGDFILCGDRCGSVHLYGLSPNSREKPLHTIRKLHGYRGVGSIKLIDGRIISTGRDGTYRQMVIDKKEIKLIDCNKLQMEWIATIEETSIFGPLIFGFHDTHLIIWSCREGRPFLKLDCGGGHRSWNYCFDESSTTLNIAFIKNKCVYSYCKSLYLLNYRTAEIGYHSKSINSACLLDIKSSKGCYILTGGEDNTLRLFSWENKAFKPQITLYRHISSIRGIYSLEDAVNNTFLVASCGGRGQLFMWQVFEYEGKVSIMEAATHMVRETDNQQKNFKQIEPLIDPETRYMDVNIVKISEKEFLILAGCSDGLFRLLYFNSNSNKITLAKACNFHEHCILKVAHFIWEDIIAITMTTAGKLAFWNVNSLLNQDDINFEPVSFSVHSLGINSYSLLLLKDTLILATGSDDSTLAVTAFGLHKNNNYTLLTSWLEKTLHTCQITGVQILENFIITVALDQKVSLLKWEYHHEYLTVRLIKQVATSVPDIHGLLAWFKPQYSLNVCIFGLGIELFKYEHNLEKKDLGEKEKSKE